MALGPARDTLPKWPGSLLSTQTGTDGVMFRLKKTVFMAVIAIAPALAGCSGTSLSSYLPGWLSPTPAPPPTQALQFESLPPGADARTEQGQTCLTPCSLPVPVTNQSVTFVLNGYVSQTLQVAISPAGDLMPNPLTISMQPIGPPPKPLAKPRRRRPKTASRPPPQLQPSIAAPEETAPPPSAASPFPPPPSPR
jgi:hypothetical protein